MLDKHSPHDYYEQNALYFFNMVTFINEMCCIFSLWPQVCRVVYLLNLLAYIWVVGLFSFLSQYEFAARDCKKMHHHEGLL